MNGSSELLNLAALCETDSVAKATLATLGYRLQLRDPAILGTYAEHLVAESIGGRVVQAGWGPIDVIWNRNGTTEIGIQVKAAGLHHVFSEGVARSVSFSTASSKSILGVFANDDVAPARAPVWVLALHTDTAYDRGWRFFVLPGKYLDILGKSSITLNSLVLRLGMPVQPEDLAPLISCAYDNEAVNTDPLSWTCPICRAEFARHLSLTAHQAAASHSWTSADFIRTLDGSGLSTDEALRILDGIEKPDSDTGLAPPGIKA